MPRPTCGLYLVTPLSLTTGALATQDFLPMLQAALEATEIQALLLRSCASEAKLDDARLSSQIEALLPIAHAAGLPLVVEERADLVARLGADGVHLKAQRQTIAAVRKTLGADAIVGAAAGISRHDAMEAAEAGADYVSFGFFDPEPQPPEAEILTWWQEMMEPPCVAMGGITLQNARALYEAGADFLALRNAVWNHESGPAKALKAFAKLLS